MGSGRKSAPQRRYLTVNRQTSQKQMLDQIVPQFLSSLEQPNCRLF